MKEFIKKHAYAIALVAVTIIMVGWASLDNTKQAHDLPFHLANIDNIVSNNLKITPIMPNLAYGLGYGIYIFYPVLSHFFYAVIASVLSVFGVKTVSSILVTNVIVSVISSLTMYFAVSEITKNKKWAFVSALIYMLFPYRLGTITVRMALAENFISIFIPVVLLSIYYLFNDEKKKFYISFIIGYTGAILSHYVMSVYFTVFVFLILLFNIKKLFENKRILMLLIATIAVCVLVLPNIILFVENYSGDYLISTKNYVTSEKLIEDNILELKEFVIPTEEYNWTIPYYTYVPVLIFCVFSAYVGVKNMKKDGLGVILLIGLIILCVVAICCMPLWKMLPDFVYNIQFPWRLLIIFATLVSILAPMFLKEFDRKIVFLITIILCVMQAPFLINKLNNRIYHFDYSNPEIEKGVGNMNEYYPTKCWGNKKYYENKIDIDIVEGVGDVTVTNRENGEMEFTVSNSKDLEIELPTIYYKGYKLTHNEEKIDIEYNEYGLVTVKAEDGNYKLEYTGTFLYNLFRIIRIVAIIGLIGYIIKLKLWVKN